MATTSKRRNAEPPADSFERLVFELEKLPGVGRRSAERMAYHLLEVSSDEAMQLALAIRDMKKNLRPCQTCGNLTEETNCSICQDARRDAGLICVVEWPREIRAIEKSGVYRGRYHVLMGRISPLSGIEPTDLRIKELLLRVKKNAISEIILACSPTMEGDATATFIRGKVLELSPKVKVTRIARGLPQGSDLSFAQSGTLGQALEGRTDA